MISTYFGSMTIVLKLPLTRAASTNGLHRYNGFWMPGTKAEGDAGGAPSLEEALGNVADVGVGERLGPRGPERCIERLRSSKKDTCQREKKKPLGARTTLYRVPYRVEKRHDLGLGCLQDWRQHGWCREDSILSVVGWARSLMLFRVESPWRLSCHVFAGFGFNLDLAVHPSVVGGSLDSGDSGPQQSAGS